jgi:hypothetical protein
MVTGVAQGRPVVHVETAFRVFGERTDMMRVNFPAPLVAVLAGEVVAREHGGSPVAVVRCVPERLVRGPDPAAPIGVRLSRVVNPIELACVRDASLPENLGSCPFAGPRPHFVLGLGAMLCARAALTSP